MFSLYKLFWDYMLLAGHGQLTRKRKGAMSRVSVASSLCAGAYASIRDVCKLVAPMKSWRKLSQVCSEIRFLNYLIIDQRPDYQNIARTLYAAKCHSTGENMIPTAPPYSYPKQCTGNKRTDCVEEMCALLSCAGTKVKQCLLWKHCNNVCLYLQLVKCKLPASSKKYEHPHRVQSTYNDTEKTWKFNRNNRLSLCLD